MPRDIADCDTDASYINPSFPTFLDGWTMTGFDNYNNYYRPLPVTPCAVTNTAIYTLPDKDKNNDWDNVFGTVLHDNGGGFYNAHPEYTLYQKNVSPGTYIVSFKAKLVGKNIFNVSSDVEKDSVTCGETTIEYSFYRYHAQPSFFFDETTGYFGGSRGYGLTSEEKTASYMVEPQPTVPVPDNSPPVVVVYSNYPSNGETLAPGVIGTTNYLRITVADDGVGAGPINLSTFILAKFLFNSLANLFSSAFFFCCIQSKTEDTISDFRIDCINLLLISNVYPNSFISVISFSLVCDENDGLITVEFKKINM